MDLNTVITIDHTDRMRHVRDYSYNRERTIHLSFTRQAGEEGYLVHAWGSAFPQDGGGGYRGRIADPGNSVQSAIDIVRKAWREQVIEHCEVGDTGRCYPFVDQFDLSGDLDRHRLDGIGLELARAGDTLYWALFGQGDDGITEIAEHLLHALRSGEHVITMESDKLFVPWGLIYTALDETHQLLGPNATWSMDGFWGYRHLIEHGFSRAPGFDSRIQAADGPVLAGLNVDPAVDDEYPKTEFVERVVAFFEKDARTYTDVRVNKDELAVALLSPTFGEHITYFGCHAEVGTAHTEPPYLLLGDKKQIRGVELLGWIARRPERCLPSQPVVFISACQGGQLCSRFYDAFGYDLLRSGARCLIGPQIDLPRRFAAEYTLELFEAFLEPGTRLGDVIRSLARRFADEYGNPLGLVFSLYRGMDVHFGPAT